MESNSGQNMSQSSGHREDHQRRHHNHRRTHESNGLSDDQYLNHRHNRYPQQSNYHFQNDFNRYPQYSEPQTFGYFNGQPFDSNDRQFTNYRNSYVPNNNQMRGTFQRWGFPDVSLNYDNRRQYTQRYKRNHRSNDGQNLPNVGSNVENQENGSNNNNSNNSSNSNTNNTINDNLEERPQNASGGQRVETQTNKEVKENERKVRQKRYPNKNKRENNGRHESNGSQTSHRNQTFEQKVEKQNMNSAKNSNTSDKKTIGPKTGSKPKLVPESDESQREIMEELLRKGEFECMVCYYPIGIRDWIWNCQHCYNVFHMKCIKKWANSQSSGDSQSWRCPTCQTNHLKIPSVYYCFCGKYKEPELNRYLVPHSCGETCGRKRKSDPTLKYNCPHKCFLQCHPGSCPPCEMKVNRECGCGQTRITVSCRADDTNVICNKVCNKRLNCGQHICERICHSDKCLECPLTKTQICFCGQNKREVECNVENNLIENYCCEQKCNKTLKCGNHKCDRICHFGDCGDCPLLPESVTHCFCGKTPLNELSKSKRQSCLDPISKCHQICGKELICGSEKERHHCRYKCHSGQCPPCDQKTVIRCRCGANSDNIMCIQLTKTDNKTFICKKRCNRKRICGRHKCLNECCIESEHRCQQICGKKLSCGLHSCEELCHSGSCPQCWNVSWDELSCRCGGETKLPPIACGTKRPECKRICSRNHRCDHPIDHKCHDDEECPPCTYFTPKSCYGNHMTRKVHCYETSFSCGYLCDKQLDCALHKCQMLCHFGNCNECTLGCTKTRKDCGHLCALKCHQKTSPDICPKSNCKVMVKVFCDCGRKTDLMPCFKVNDENSLRLSFNSLANQRIKNGESVDVTQFMKNIKDFKYIQLKCDEKCAVIERNKQLAEALDVKDADFNPDPGPPKYSDLLKNSARNDPNFVKDVYEKLAKLVLDSKQSRLSFKNMNFPPMNSENRHFIHELAEHFGCKTHAIDREPNRSVVVKAVKDKCYLPTVSLIDFVKEETETRKTAQNKTNKITLKSHCFDTGSDDMNLLSVGSGLSLLRNTSVDSIPSNKNSGQNIDYFDFRGD